MRAWEDVSDGEIGYWLRALDREGVTTQETIRRLLQGRNIEVRAARAEGRLQGWREAKEAAVRRACVWCAAPLPLDGVDHVSSTGARYACSARTVRALPDEPPKSEGEL